MFGVEFLSLGVSLGSFQLTEDIYRVQIPVRGVRRGGCGRGWNVFLPLPLIHGGRDPGD